MDFKEYRKGNNMNHYADIIMKALISISASLTIMLFIIFAYTYGPDIEAKLFPVVTDFTLLTIKQDHPNSVIISGTLIKARENCVLVGIDAYMSDQDHLVKELVRIESLTKTPAGLLVRIGGLQEWGPWRIASKRKELPTTLEIHSQHKCHPLYLVRHKLASIELEQF